MGARAAVDWRYRAAARGSGAVVRRHPEGGHRGRPAQPSVAAHDSRLGSQPSAWTADAGGALRRRRRGRTSWQRLWDGCARCSSNQPSARWHRTGWWVIGAIGLVAWGVREGRQRESQHGSARFLPRTALAFDFSQVMDKLGRSASLIGLGAALPGRRLGARTDAAPACAAGEGDAMNAQREKG